MKRRKAKSDCQQTFEGHRKRPKCTFLLLLLAFMALQEVILSVKARRIPEKPPVPDDCSSTPFENGLSLTCSLSAINSADERTNFSVVPSEHTLALTVRCRDSTLSQLEAEGFKSLRHLKRLTLDGCHLRSIPARAFWGLTKLRTLSIKTRNAGVLSISSDAFLGLEDLENLDLSGNYIRYLSPNALCPLQGLQTLNLSRNEIGGLADLGNSMHCIEKVSSVDLSYNQLPFFAGFTAMMKLQELRLSNNKIRDIKKDALIKHPNLKFIDLSNNRLSSLPEDVFATSRNLKWVSLSNNSLAFLPNDLFKEPSQSLEVLDLSGNLIPTLTAPLLSNLQSLTSLDLSRNEIVSIGSAAALKGLNELKSLKLAHNKLARLPVLSLSSLRSLVLSHNDIGGRLSPTRIFSRLPLLSHLLLDNNQIDELPSQVFVNSTKITVLDLSHNKIRGNVPNAINQLQSLQSLSLSKNKLNVLSKLRLPALWRLQASGNRIDNVSKSHFNSLPSLQVLDLSNNRIETVEKGTFGTNKPLKAVRLDENKLKRIEGLFTGLPNLSWLNVSANEISVFDYGMIPKTLQWLDKSMNFKFGCLINASFLISLILLLLNRSS